MMLYILFITCALVIISLITVSNVLLFPRLRPAQEQSTEKLPLVSILIPARDEAANIGPTIRALLVQEYPHFEVVVLDDGSTDETAAIARNAGSGDPRLTVAQGKSLPEGWLGKNWACHQLSRTASGDIFIFTDADVRWQSGALRAVVGAMQTTDADLFTVWPTQITHTWPERLVVPLMALVVLGYLPVIGTHYSPLSAFAAANGQCMVWRRDSYDIVGGHVPVRDNVLEDVTLARIVKQHGLRLRMADGNRLISCRMYEGWPQVRDGYAKNILAGYGNSVTLLLLATLFHWSLFLFPWIWLAVGNNLRLDGAWPAWPLAMIALGLLVRMLTASFTRQRIVDGLGLPLSVLLMTRIAFQAAGWHYRYGGPRWKGRSLSQKDTAPAHDVSPHSRT